MKNFDILSRRILVIALSITMVLCSISLLFYSMKSASAAPLPLKSNTIQAADIGFEEFPFGVSNGRAYWIEHSDADGSWNFYSRSTDNFKTVGGN